MNGDKRQQLGKSVLVMAGLFLMLLLFAPAAYSVGWRILNSRQAVVGGLSFLVPSGWVTVPEHWDSASGATMMKLPSTIFGMTGPIPTIKLYQRGNHNLEGSEALRRWRETAPKQFESRGYRLKALKQFDSPTNMVCIELSRQAGPAEVTCMLEANRLMADYYGDEAITLVFYNVIRSAHL